MVVQYNVSIVFPFVRGEIYCSSKRSNPHDLKCLFTGYICKINKHVDQRYLKIKNLK